MIRICLMALLGALLMATDLDPPGTEVVVVFNRTRFEPATVEIRRGTRVTFHSTHAGSETSTIVASDGSFESVPLGRDGEWSHRFLESGEHGYFVKEQPEVKGRALVE